MLFFPGTRGSVWLNGTHPVIVNETKEIQACARVRSDCCFLRWNIQVKKCYEPPNHFFVYYLVATPGCPMAYCAG